MARPVAATMSTHSVAESKSANDRPTSTAGRHIGKARKSVDDPGREVGADADSGAHRRCREVQKEQPRQSELFVSPHDGYAGAEHIDEQQREEHGLNGHIRQLRRLSADVDQVPAGHDDYVVHDRAQSARPGPRYGRVPAPGMAAVMVIGLLPPTQESGWYVHLRPQDRAKGRRCRCPAR